MARRSKRNRSNVAKTVTKNRNSQFNASAAGFLGRNDTLVSTPKKRVKWKTNYSVTLDAVIDDNTSRRSRSERAARMLDRKKRDIIQAQNNLFTTPLRGVAASRLGGVTKAQSPVSDSQRKMRDCVQRPDPNGGGSQSVKELETREGRSKKQKRKYVKWC